MRFKADIQNATVFSRFVGSLSSIGKVAWVRLTDSDVRFTIIPEQGTQVWAVLQIDTIFETYNVQSAAPSNAINLEVPLAPLLAALRSTSNATSASIRLTKRDGIPYLVITIATTIERWNPSSSGPSSSHHHHAGAHNHGPDSRFDDDDVFDTTNSSNGVTLQAPTTHETLITQDIPVRVLPPEAVAGLHEPRCREPDVHIVLPPLSQLKAVSERFTKLGLATASTSTSNASGGGRGDAGANAAGSGLGNKAPRLELSATMHGDLRLSLRNDGLSIASTWQGLTNPELDPGAVEGGEDGVRTHPSTRMRERGGETGHGADDGDADDDDDAAGGNDEEDDMLQRGWARVRIDSRDWSKVLSVGRLGGRVIACFCHDHALILYVYLSSEDSSADESVLTYYVSSYSL